MSEEKIDLASNTPEKTIRASPLSATIWTNEVASKDGQVSMYRTIVVERSYKDKDGEWKKTNSMRINDLPKVMLLVSKAYEYISLKDDDTEEGINVSVA